MLIAGIGLTVLKKEQLALPIFIEPANKFHLLEGVRMRAGAQQTLLAGDRMSHELTVSRQTGLTVSLSAITDHIESLQRDIDKAKKDATLQNEKTSALERRVEGLEAELNAMYKHW